MKPLIGASLLSLAAVTAQAQTFHTGNGSIDGNLCVGGSCTSTETFSNVQLRLKSGRMNLEFVDESSATFPTTDWNIKINDNASLGLGGENHFTIQDTTAGTDIFRLNGGAPSNSFYMASDGKIGLGTSLPQQDLHITASSSPQIRLEQSSTPYSWDIIATHNDFFIKDNTANTFPLVIKDAAPDFSLHVLSDGNVGLGTINPTAPLHIPRTDGTAQILVENTAASPSAVREMFKMANNGGAYFTLDNTSAGTTWFFSHENSAPNRFIIADNVADGPEMTLTAEGNLTIPGTLTTGGGTCGGGCDAVFTEGYNMPTIAEHSAKMFDLGYLPNVGPTVENQPINVSDKLGRMLNELEVAHIYIGKLHDRQTSDTARIDAQDAQLSQQAELIGSLIARLEVVEAQ